jgi:hypothetical protein
MILENLKIETGRCALEWVSAAEAPRFVQVITEFDARIRDFGPIGHSEGLDRQALLHKIRAAKIALEGRKVRMSLARESMKMKKHGTYGELSSREKLSTTIKDETILYETLLYLQEKERPASELAELLGISLDKAASCIETLRKKKMWNGDLYGDRLSG